MARSARRRAPQRAPRTPVRPAAPAADGTVPARSAAPIARPQPRRRSPFAALARLQPRFVADIVAELRKVTWPSASDTRYLTMVVAIVAIAVGAILGAFDLLFGWIIEQLFF